MRPRVSAAIADFVIIVLLEIAIPIVVMLAFLRTPFTALEGAIVVFSPLALVCIFEVFHQSSIGKWFYGFRIWAASGGKPATWRIAVRTLIKYLFMIVWWSTPFLAFPQGWAACIGGFASLIILIICVFL